MGTIKVPAWLVDGMGDVWALYALDPAGTGMPVYALADAIAEDDDGPEVLLRVLAIEDAHGIERRGPGVDLESPLADQLATANGGG